MAGLTTALSNALSGLMVTSGQSAVVSRNIARAGDETYTRKTASVIGAFDGSAKLSTIARSSETRLVSSVLAKSSSLATQDAIGQSLATLAQTIGDVEDDGSIAWGIGQLQQAVQQAAANPSSRTLATQAVGTAQQLATSLNAASQIVQDVRQRADAGLAQSVNTINGLLERFQSVNGSIVAGGPSVNRPELMDERDAILKQLSSEIGIRTVNRADMGMAIYTESGITLFDVSARSVTFQPTPGLAPGASGNQVFVDGVQATGAGAAMPLRSGSIVGLVEVRDQLAPTYQSQLDEVARGLITCFAETDQQPVPTLPPAVGLFTYAGAPAVPAGGTAVAGLAGNIRVAAAFDANSGGNPFLLRDGGVNGAAYVQNTQNLPGFQARLLTLSAALDGPQAFDGAAGLGASASLKSFAASSAGWLEDKRQAVSGARDAAQTYLQRANDALQRRAGVNLDEEMATLLNLEKSYQASAKVMSTINAMFGVLVGVVN